MTSEEQAIVACALDYYEGWFDADPARMERALHPQLVKRALVDSAETLDATSAAEMVGDTIDGWGPRFDPGDRRIRIRVDDGYDRIATATVHSAVYVDYLQLVRTRDGWKIANVLWEWTPEGRALRESVRGTASSAPRADS